MSVIVGLEGYTTPSGYILKELCILFPSLEWQHYIFKTPNAMFTEADRRAARYATTHLSGLSIHDGTTDYGEIKQILEYLQNLRIYTYSEIAVKVLEDYYQPLQS